MSVKEAIKKIIFFGTKYKCNFCNSSLKKFHPRGQTFKILKEKNIIGGLRRETGNCPICSRTDRERLLNRYIFLSEKIKLEDVTILHIAPEKGLEKKFRNIASKKNIEYFTGDKFEEGYSYNCPTVDITNTDFKDNTFSLLLCNHVLEHIPNDRDAMKEIYRILKPGGSAILQVPISTVLDETFEDFSVIKKEDREEVFGQYDHVRIYGQDYTQRLRSCGFNVTVEDPNRLFGEKIVRKEGLNPEEKIFIAIKPENKI